MKKTGKTVVWFRRDLRLSDHAPLVAAAQRGQVIPVYILPSEADEESLGAASKWWLHHSLKQLERALEAKGLRLIYRSGPLLQALDEICQETDADGLVWHRLYEKRSVEIEDLILQRFRERLDFVEGFPGSLLVEPWSLMNQSGSPFKVFTPFWKRCIQRLSPARPLPSPRGIESPTNWPRSEGLDDWRLLPSIPWADGLSLEWQPGEQGALAQLDALLGERLLAYYDERNRPDHEGTSRLSPYLHFGELSPRQIWAALDSFAIRNGIGGLTWKGWQFVSELGWREFAAYLLYHFPSTVSEPLRAEFKHYPWDSKKTHLKAWQQGQTGYPMVDAGMRELWHMGWMHNRVRMIVASFLIKHLLVPWQDGAAWFWDTLVDADLASNTLGWQWTAGCGADAAPYFRIFNPITQGEKFDPNGDYVRRWVPELASLPDKYLNRPWEAPVDVLRAGKVTLGLDYPHPVVDHPFARQRALDGYAKMRNA